MNEQQFIFADEDAWLPDNPGFPLNGVLSPRTMSLDATFLQCLAGVDTNNGGGLLSPFDREHSLDLSTWAPNHDCMSPRLGASLSRQASTAMALSPTAAPEWGTWLWQASVPPPRLRLHPSTTPDLLPPPAPGTAAAAAAAFEAACSAGDAAASVSFSPQGTAAASVSISPQGGSFSPQGGGFSPRGAAAESAADTTCGIKMAEGAGSAGGTGHSGREGALEGEEAGGEEEEVQQVQQQQVEQRQQEPQQQQQRQQQQSKPWLAPGQLCWGKMALYPWWPCITLAANDPAIPAGAKPAASKGGSHVPVRFFGPGAEVSFMFITNLSPWVHPQSAERANRSKAAAFIQALSEARAYADSGALPPAFATPAAQLYGAAPLSAQQKKQQQQKGAGKKAKPRAAVKQPPSAGAAAAAAAAATRSGDSGGGSSSLSAKLASRRAASADVDQFPH